MIGCAALMRPTWTVVIPALLAGCGGSHAAANARAKARIFAPAGDERPPAPATIEVRALEGSTETQDAVLGMSEAELRQRVGAFRLHAKVRLIFGGSGQTVAIDEERLAEQAKSGDVHLRIADGDGDGMEIISVGGKVYGRSRYGPFVLRDRQSGLAEQREEVSGTLSTLYALADRGLRLHELGPGRGCTRFGVALGAARPEREPPRFGGRLDRDTLERFQFVYSRRLTEGSGEICVNPQGVVTAARLALRWVASGDAGAGDARAELDETLTDLGADVRVAPPEGFQPEPHRPRGPFATLERFGFIEHPDAGTQ